VNSLVQVSLVTFKELLRERTLHGLLVIFFLMSLFSLLLGQLSFAEQIKMSLDFGLSIMHISMVGLSILLGSQLIHREIERKTIFTLLVRPLSRTQYLFGKFFGLWVLMFFTAFVCAMFLSFCLLYFGAFYFFEVFLSAFGTWIECGFLIALMSLLDQKLRPPVAVFCGFALFLIGHWFETLEHFVEKSPGGVLFYLHQFLSGAFPNLETWNWRTLVVYQEFLTPEDFGRSVITGFLWIFVYLFLASFLFERRDLVA